MQPTHLLTILPLFCAPLATAQIITATQIPSSAQATKLFGDLDAYESSADAQPIWTSIQNAIASASAPTSLPAVYFSNGNWEAAISEINYDITASFPNQASEPTEVVAYIKSFMAAEAEIWNEDLATVTSPAGNTPTGTSPAATTSTGSAGKAGVPAAAMGVVLAAELVVAMVL